MFNGVRYESVRQAVTNTGISRTEIYRRLRDPKVKDIYYITEAETSFGKIPVFAKKDDGPSVFFESYKECVAAGYVKCSSNIRKNIKAKKEGWRFAHVDINGNPLKTPYPFKEGELKFQMVQE